MLQAFDNYIEKNKSAVMSQTSGSSNHIRLIHCADLHLDSLMEAHLSAYEAQNRRKELLSNLVSLSDYALSHEVRAILMCGDIFDTPCIPPSSLDYLLRCVETHPLLDYVILPGNHDENLIRRLMARDVLPHNLILPDYSSYTEPLLRYDNIAIYALPSSLKDFELPTGLKDDFNIFLYHGQILSYVSSDSDSYQICESDLRDRNIDYLAAGHLHTYQEKRLDARGIYCYSGCLEGRGFDECGDKGFVLLDIHSLYHTYTRNFISFSRRHFHQLNLELDQAKDYADIERLCLDALAPIDKKDFVRIQFSGKVRPELRLHTDWLKEKFASSYYYLEFSDCTVVQADPQDYATDISLKGEFIRLVLQDTNTSEHEKELIIREGLKALSGEEIDLLL